MSDTPSSESPPPLDSSSGPPVPPPLDPPPLPPDLSSLLSRLPPTPVPQGLPHFPSTPREQPKQTRETTDERCWISTNQSNARRALGLEPQISMHCYINFRNSLSSLTPVPGHPNAFLARDAPSTLPITPEELADGPGKLKKVVLKSSRTGEKDIELPKYHWDALDGRYWYVAKGRENVERHFKEMGDLGKVEREEGKVEDGVVGNVNSWKMIRRIKERIEKQKEEDSIPGKREERQVKRALGIIDLNKNSESLTSLSSFYSTSLQRLHAHVLRIYTPLLTSLQLLPATYTDGTQRELLSTIFTRLTDGSAFTLGERMYSSLGKVAGELKERRERRGGGPGTGGLGGMPPSSDVGLGGQQPRVPNRGSLPSLPPLGNLSPPPPSNPPVEDGNEGAGAGGAEEGKGPRGRGRPPPETVSIGCSLM